MSDPRHEEPGFVPASLASSPAEGPEGRTLSFGGNEGYSLPSPTFLQEPDYQPLYHRVLVRRFEAEREEKTDGGLFLVSEPSPLLRAVVVAVGQGRLLLSGSIVPLAVKPGDVVLVPAASGMVVSRRGRLWVVDEEQIVVRLP